MHSIGGSWQGCDGQLATGGFILVAGTQHRSPGAANPCTPKAIKIMAEKDMACCPKTRSRINSSVDHEFSAATTEIRGRESLA